MLNDFFVTVSQNRVPERVIKTLPGKTGATLRQYADGLRVVVKQVDTKSTKKQRGISVKNSGRHAVAFYKLAKLLGWDNLLPKITRKYEDGSEYAIQQYVSAVSCGDIDPDLAEGVRVDKRLWVNKLRKVCSVVPDETWLKVILLDILACSRDRHINNIGFVTTGTVNTSGRADISLVAWDNAVTFGLYFTKYKQVFHKYLFADSVPLCVKPYLDMLNTLTLDAFMDTLGDDLTQTEIVDLYLRMQFILRYPHKLPYTLFSEGAVSSDMFPSRKSYFLLNRTQNYNTVILGTNARIP